MPADPVREIFLGFIRLHILYHAQTEPVYGVGLMRELQRHGYDVGPGTLYPTLHALERQGYLRSDLERVVGRRRRVYRATQRGRALLVEGRQRAKELLMEIESRTRVAAGRAAPARRVH